MKQQVGFQYFGLVKTKGCYGYGSPVTPIVRCGRNIVIGPPMIQHMTISMRMTAVTDIFAKKTEYHDATL